MNENDCILFVDEEMARFIIVYQRSADKKIENMAKTLGLSKGQTVDMQNRAKQVGIILENEQISEMAIKCVQAIQQKHVEQLRN